MKIDDQLAKMQTPFIPSTVGYIVKGDRVLLGLRKKVSLDLALNVVAGIGGKVEPGETSDEALVREFQEEINVTPTEFVCMGHIRFLFPHQPKWQQDVAAYLITQWNGTPTETDVIKPIWYPQDQLPFNQMWPDNQYWVPFVIREEKLDGIFLYDENRNIIEQELVHKGF